MAWHDEARHLPWSVDGEVLRDDNGDEVAVFAGDTNEVERALLAAAPELLAALKEVVTPGAHTPETWDVGRGVRKGAGRHRQGGGPLMPSLLGLAVSLLLAAAFCALIVVAADRAQRRNGRLK